MISTWNNYWPLERRHWGCNDVDPDFALDVWRGRRWGQFRRRRTWGLANSMNHRSRIWTQTKSAPHCLQVSAAGRHHAYSLLELYP